MREVGENLWVVEARQRFLGLEVGTRMTVVRLPGRRLLVHSPIRYARSVAGALAEHGEVAHLVAPNRLHHLYVADWRDAYPEATLHVSPGLPAKRPDLASGRVLSDQAPAEWAGALEQRVVGGFPFADEVVFFHRESRTLILTDLAFRIGPEAPALTRWVFAVIGGYRRLGPTVVERALIRDSAKFRASLDAILDWPFERVIVAHGEITEAGAREALEAAYRWVRPRPVAPDRGRLRRGGDD